MTRLASRWTNLPLRSKALVTVLLPACALASSMLLSHWAAQEERRADQVAKNNQEIRAQAQNLFIILISAESEVRDLGLNGTEEGIQSFGIAEASVEAELTKIQELLPAAPDKAAQLDNLRKIIRARFAGLKQLRAYYSDPAKRGTMAPPEMVRAARMSPEIPILVAKMFANDASHPSLEQSVNAHVEQMHAAAVATGLLAAIAAIVLMFFFARNVAQRIRLLEAAASDLERGRPIGSDIVAKDEIGRLGETIVEAGRVLAGQREELKVALESGELLIWELDAASGRIRYQAGSGTLPNAQFPSELLPETITELAGALKGEDGERIKHEVQRITTTGGAFQFEYSVVIRGGETRWLLIKAQSHVSGGNASPRLLGVLADIGARKKALGEIERQARELARSQEALQQQTRILESILASMGDGVVVADTSGKFLVFNPAAGNMLGSRSFAGEPAEWPTHYGLFLADRVTLYPSDQLPFVRAIRGEPVDEAEIFVRPAGVSEGKWVSVTARPLCKDDGAVGGGVVVIRDVTAAKRAADALNLAKQEAEDANHAKSEFLSRMSHELRTPLNSILGFAQLLELGDLTEQQLDNVRQVLKGGYHLLDLINEILDLARIEAGRLSLSAEPVQVSELLHDTLDLVRPLAGQQSVTIHNNESGCERYIMADRQRLKQVLLNLLSNAIKFNRAKGSVIVGCGEAVSGKLRIEITDTGAGISPAGLKKLFKPFERLDADTTEIGGTGLGLALSKRLIEAMGGTIGVESAVGIGSRFFVELSLVTDPARVLETPGVAGALVEPKQGAHRGTILYIEDNTSNLRLIEQILSHRPGVRLLSAMQGHLGLDLAELHRPDWILLDVHLPDISGHEVLRRLRLNPRTQDIPVTVLSADATATQINRLIQAGARDYLTKPLDVRKLLQLLETTLGGVNESALELTSYAQGDHSK